MSRLLVRNASSPAAVPDRVMFKKVSWQVLLPRFPHLPPSLPLILQCGAPHLGCVFTCAPICQSVAGAGGTDAIDRGCRGELHGGVGGRHQRRHRRAVRARVRGRRFLRRAPPRQRQQHQRAAPLGTAGVPGAGGDGAKPLPTVSFSIPTGAAGHLTAGLIAKLMGLPVERFVVANNKNHVIDRMLREGVLQVSSFVHHTNSPAMDIAAPYNIERVLWLVDSQNGERVGEWMRAFNAGEAVRLPTSVMTAFAAHGVVSASVADGGPDGVLGCIRTIRRESGYLLDPHSAVGVAAAWKMAEEGLLHGPVVCMGCAHPAKFVETVAEALEIGPDEAATAVMDPDQPCVTAVIETTSGSFSADSVPLWKAGEDWTPLLKKMIVEVTERRATEAAAAPL
ncbi:unnamed protein product [Phaeothamnion confervicola]